MNLQVRIMALVVSLLFIGYVLHLVRSRKLRETDSIIWILASSAILILGVWVKPLIFVTKLIGAKFPVSTLFFSGLIFLTFISLWMTTRISELTEQVKDLAQKVALMSEDRGKVDEKQK